MKTKPLGASVGWRTLSTKTIFESLWYRIRQDQVDVRGREITYTYMDHPGAVFIVPITKDDKIVMIRTYRYTIDEWCWEVPSGGLGDKKGKSLETIAREELFEETGGTARELEYLGSYFTANGAANLKAHFYLARDVELTQKASPEETEEIERVETWTIEQARAAVLNGTINDGESSLAIFLALEKIRSQPFV